ncbi:MAG: adenosine deaminase [Deltaproteobacteria bacterium]|nr:adenosine deaminase [Deltaproteobacteria bacterium]
MPTPNIPVTDALLHALPKSDLHCHLDGSLRLKTMLELAEQQKVKLPADTEEGLAHAMRIGERHGSLEEYLKGFDITLSVLQTEESLYRAAYELALDAHAENCRLLEVRYAPVLHGQRGLKPTVVVEAVLEGLRRAERETGIIAGVLVCGIRNMSPETSLRLAELSVAYKNKGVLGFDLAGAEDGNPAKDHQHAFQLILNNNVNCTVHAGEAYGPPSIAQALHYCGAHRIGHGVRLREDGDLLNYVNDHRIPIESCPSSNVQTGAVPDMASHPFKFYLDFGIRVTVNTDNRLITNTTVTKELGLLVKQFGLDVHDIKNVLVAGFKSAFLTFHDRAQLIRRVQKEMEETINRFAAGQGTAVAPLANAANPAAAPAKKADAKPVASA